MLKGMDPLLHADLLHVLAAMGHGDEIAVVDANFPAVTMGRRVVRLDGVDVPTAAEAVCTVLPLDRFVDAPIVRMAVVDDPEKRCRRCRSTRSPASVGSPVGTYRSARSPGSSSTTGRGPHSPCW
nr:RbsD/FucU domain-containing protein [Fodinicola feengrottensis]